MVGDACDPPVVSWAQCVSHTYRKIFFTVVSFGLREKSHIWRLCKVKDAQDVLSIQLIRWPNNVSRSSENETVSDQQKLFVSITSPNCMLKRSDSWWILSPTVHRAWMPVKQCLWFWFGPVIVPLLAFWFSRSCRSEHSVALWDCTLFQTDLNTRCLWPCQNRTMWTWRWPKQVCLCKQNAQGEKSTLEYLLRQCEMWKKNRKYSMVKKFNEVLWISFLAVHSRLRSFTDGLSLSNAVVFRLRGCFNQ